MKSKAFQDQAEVLGIGFKGAIKGVYRNQTEPVQRIVTDAGSTFGS